MKPSPPQPDYAAIKSFIETVQKPLAERFKGRLISRSYLKDIQLGLDRQWSAFLRQEPGPYLLARSCSANGLEAALHYGKLMLRWRTLFIPGPRYDSPHSAQIPLGFFRNFDMYAAYQYPIFASVFAAMPDGAVTVWHLHRHSYRPPQENAPAIYEALRRCQRVNAFFGSQWAHPHPLGRAALPLRAVYDTAF